MGGGDRWPRPLVGPPGLHRGQEHPQRQQGRGGALRRHQPVRQLLQEQAEGAGLPPPEVQRQALPRPLPLQGSLQDVLEDRQRHGAPQDREGQGGHEEAADPRGCPTPLRQEEEDGRPVCPQSSQAEARQEVLFSWTIEPRCGWKYQDVIETLEAKRKVKAQDFYNRTVTKAKAVAEAEKAVAAKTKPITAQMESFGVC